MLHSAPPWTRHLFYRAERSRTTWTLRFAVLAVTAALVWLTTDWWTVAIGRSLVCDAGGQSSDAVLVENFESEYMLFERARDIRRAGLAPRVLIPVRTDEDTSRFNDVALGITDVIAGASHLGPYEAVPMREVEPISLNVARDVLRYLERERIRSVIVVAPLFRSRRSSLVYGKTLQPAGIRVTCEPARSSATERNWTDTWHGIQNVLEQWIKLQYYRLYVLPFHNPGTPTGDA